MSMPTLAKFYNKNNEEIADQFINVGWYLNPVSLAEQLCHLARIKDCEYIIAYKYKFPSTIWARNNYIYTKFCEEIKNIMDTQNVKNA